jgi:sugar lactone lactonase YvrE
MRYTQEIRMNRLLTLIVIVVLFVPSCAMDRAHFIELNKKASELAKEKNWKGLREALIEIGREMPAPTPIYLLRMASVEARLGNHAAAVRWLEKYAAMGLKYDVAQDEDLKPLLADAAFAPVAQEMKERTKPIQKAEAVCSLPLPDLMPEDVTFDKNSGAFILSSIQHHTLYRATMPKAGAAECALQEIPLEEHARRWPVLAVSADAARKLIWMTANAMPDFTGFPKEDEGKASLFAIDAASGKTLRRFDLPNNGRAVMGDMSVAPDGTVYVSDSIGGGVYRVQGDLKTAQLEKIAGDFFSPQTPALSRDGKRLFVADYSMGIAVVDLARANPTGRLNYLPHPESVAVTGLDGLYLYGDSLIGIQNGTDPERIIRFHLNPAQTEITSSEVVEQSTARLGDPTHVTSVNGWLYATADVGWNKIDDHGQLKPGEHFSPPLLLRFK